MNEVGFQKITSFGDYLPGHHDPDFYVHVAEKEYKFDIDKTAM
ncbi:MAG TPA: class I SAM-dependent methyltransferase, partial [Prochlorococcaceae cyanobacterium Fu_MAG_134]|nr:class I SAM-dependent methyltransferase [Prochlorococcaceae cyanobacterium Fu_MAG_134]